MNRTEEELSAEEAILSRHGVRQYERGVKIPPDVLREMLTLAGRAPSSWNLQHWRFLVITEQENKDKLLPITFGQQQVSDASAVVVVLGDLQANLSAPEVYASAAPNIRETMISQIEHAYTNPAIARDEAIRNASLAAMQLMLAARAKGYDTVPMGGFDPAALSQQFGIPPRYIPVVMIPIGKAAKPARDTERFDLDKLVIQERFQ